MQDEILQQFQIRKSNKEKDRFIDYLSNRLIKAGYAEEDIRIQAKGKGLFRTQNIIVGNPDEAKIIIGAHYDTCALSPVPNFMAPTNPFLFLLTQFIILITIILISGLAGFGLMLLSASPLVAYFGFLGALIFLTIQLMFGFKNRHTANDNTSGIITITQILETLEPEYRSKVCAVYFDNEEKGLLGSGFFADKHSKIKKEKILINFDCVGDGTHLVSMAKRKARKEPHYQLFTDILQKHSATNELQYHPRKMLPMMFPSDQIYFRKGIGVCALKRSPLGLYCARIHTPFDTHCREENIQFLSESLVDYITKL